MSASSKRKSCGTNDPLLSSKLLSRDKYTPASLTFRQRQTTISPSLHPSLPQPADEVDEFINFRHRKKKTQ